MKKFNLIIIALMAISIQSFANMQTTGWRWVQDDGDMDNATWVTSEDCQPMTITSNQTLRLRVRIDNPIGDTDFTTTGLGYGAKETVYLQYEDNPESPKFSDNEDFSISGANECFTALGPAEFFDFVSSTHVTDGEETEPLGVVFNSLNAVDAQTAFSPGIFMSSSQSYTLGQASYTEIEYCFKPTEHIENGTYYFLGGGENNILHPGASKLETFPELIVDITTGVSDLNAADFKVFATAGNIKVYDLPRGASNVTLYNMIGSVSKTLKVNDSQNAINIETSDLAKGLYIVNVQSAKGKVQKKVLVK